MINDVNLPEYQGDSDTVSRSKCKTAFDIIKSPVLVEDTSLCFDALNGKKFIRNHITANS